MPRLYTHTLINLQVFEGLLVMSACPGSDWSITCRLVPDFSAYIYICIYITDTYVKVMCAHLSSPLKWKLLPHWSHDRPAKAGTCKHAEKMCGILHLHAHVLLMSQQARGVYRYLLGDNFGRGQIVENRVMDKSSHECISMKYNHITHASDIVHAIQHPPAGT